MYKLYYRQYTELNLKKKIATKHHLSIFPSKQRVLYTQLHSICCTQCSYLPDTQIYSPWRKMVKDKYIKPTSASPLPPSGENNTPGDCALHVTKQKWGGTISHKLIYPNQAPHAMCLFLTDIPQFWNSQIFCTWTYFASAYAIQHVRGTTTMVC